MSTKRFIKKAIILVAIALILGLIVARLTTPRILITKTIDTETFPSISLPPEEYPTTNSLIHIYKNKKELHYYSQDKTMVYKIATGLNEGDKEKVGDNKTPLGKFSIVSIENSSDWIWDPEGKKDGPIPDAYGPWFIRFDNKRWSGIGIHGTHDPDSIGTNTSHGCIRMHNEDLEELKKLVTINTPVEIFE